MSEIEQSNPVDLTQRQTAVNFSVCFDEPSDWDQRVRWLRLRGWCVASDCELLTSVRVRLRDTIFPGYFEIDRPEVADYLGLPNAPVRCGFTVDLRVPPGESELRLQVAGVDEHWRTAFKKTISGPWFSSQAKPDSCRETDLANATTFFDFWFHHPTDWSKPASTLYIVGWCVDRTGAWIHGIRGRIGTEIFAGNYGMVRKDVASIYPNFASARDSGFSLAVRPPAGKSVLVLEVKNAAGGWRPFFRHEIYGGTTKADFVPSNEEEKVSFPPEHPAGRLRTLVRSTEGLGRARHESTHLRLVCGDARKIDCGNAGAGWSQGYSSELRAPAPGRGIEI